MMWLLHVNLQRYYLIFPHPYFCSLPLSPFQLQEEHKKVLVQRDFQLQSMSLQTRLQQKFWSQERNVLVQESQQLKQILLLVSLKLRWLLKQWRLGKKLDAEGKDMLQVLRSILYRHCVQGCTYIRYGCFIPCVSVSHIPNHPCFMSCAQML